MFTVELYPLNEYVQFTLNPLVQVIVTFELPSVVVTSNKTLFIGLLESVTFTVITLVSVEHGDVPLIANEDELYGGVVSPTNTIEEFDHGPMLKKS